MKVYVQGCTSQLRGGGRSGVGPPGGQNYCDPSVCQLADNLKADATVGTGHHRNHVVVRAHSRTPSSVFLNVGTGPTHPTSRAFGDILGILLAFVSAPRSHSHQSGVHAASNGFTLVSCQRCLQSAAVKNLRSRGCREEMILRSMTTRQFSQMPPDCTTTGSTASSRYWSVESWLSPVKPVTRRPWTMPAEAARSTPRPLQATNLSAAAIARTNALMRSSWLKMTGLFAPPGMRMPSKSWGSTASMAYSTS